MHSKLNFGLGLMSVAVCMAVAGTGMGFGPEPKKITVDPKASVPTPAVKAAPAIDVVDDAQHAVLPGVDGVSAGLPQHGVLPPGTRIENNGAGLFDTPPALDPDFMKFADELREANDPHYFEFAKSSPGYDPSKIKPDGPETLLPGTGIAPAPDTFRFWRNHSLDADIGGSASFSDRSNEPSLGGLNDTVFWSGNWYAARSMNRGVNFQFVNPYDNFPADGVNDVPNGSGSFCCDQVVNYSTGYGLTIWLLQYSVNGSSNNVQRIAVANGNADLRDNNWSTWDFSAQSFGFPSGDWCDFPDMMCTDSRLFVATNIFDASDSYQGTVVWSAALSDLAAGGGLPYWYYSRTDGGRRLCQGSTTNGWFAQHLNNTTVRLWNWAGDGNGATTYDVGHNAIGNGSMAFTGPSGCNWMGRADNRILGAARGGGDILLMWMSSPQGGFLTPYTQSVRIRESDRAVLAQDSIFNNTAVWCYPAVAANANGDYGGVITYGDANTYPSPHALLADNYNSKGLQPATIATIGVGSTCQSVNRWGDYTTARRSSLGGNSFITASFYNSSASGTQPMFTWFSREVNNPGPDIANESFTAPGGVYDPGDTFTANYVARNVGADTSGAVTVESRLSTNAIISTGDALMGSAARGAFSPGTQFSGTVSSTIPAGTADGIYYVGVIYQTTPDNFFSNNYNDYFNTPPTITVRSRPDIDVTNVQWTGVPSRKLGIGQQIPWFSIFWTHHNNGTKASSYDVDIRASLNTTISTGDVQLTYYGTGLFSPLAPGASQSWYNNYFAMPTSMTPGLYYIGVITTDTDDSNTGNNTSYDPVRVNIQWCDVDFDHDGVVDLFDYFTWFNWWDASDARADIDGNKGLDLGDFFFFFNAWDNQCFANP